MKFDLYQDPALRRAQEMIQEQERLLGSSSLKAIAEAARSPAERLGLTDTAWDQVQRELKLRDQIELAERHGLPKHVWDTVQEQVKLEDQMKTALGLGPIGDYIDQHTKDTILGKMSVVGDTIDKLPAIGDALASANFTRPYEVIDITPPPMPDFNAGPRLLKRQLEVAERHLETAQQAQRDAERREQDAERREREANLEAQRQRRNARIANYLAFAALLAGAIAFLYDKF